MKQVTNELVAYRISCCGDEHESTWHVKSIHIADHDSKLEEHKMEAAARHEKIVAWKEKHGIGN